MSAQSIRYASVIAALHLVSAASAQSTFSLDAGSATFGALDAFSGTPILPGDILTPSTGPAPGPNLPSLAAPTPPGIAINANLDLGFPATQRPEVDALSFGDDFPVGPTSALPGTYWFSVDEVARGVPSTAPAPTVYTEGALMAGTFTDYEAAADMFTDLGGTVAPMSPTATPGGNAGMIDGNGLASFSGAAYPGFGLVEPGGLWPFTGDDVDAAEVDGGFGYPAYFSLDAAWIDPVLGTPLLGSAAGFGAVAGDVLVTLAPGGPPVLYAPAAALGLDFFGPDTDDLDALALWENGVVNFQPAQQAYDWVSGTPTDMLIFSVRRGSAVIGMPDSLYGLPIEEGDLLSTPLPTSFGGVSPFPSIWIAAENLGLQTARTFLFNGNTGDDVDALDMRQLSGADCNGNGVPDAFDIVSGSSSDVNFNGIPDDCELISEAFCYCNNASAPCGNPYLPGGCENGTGVGAIMTGSGTSSVLNDDLYLDMIQLPPSNWGIVFMGTIQIAPATLGNGIRCVGGNLFRYLPAFWTGAGSASVGPMVGLSPGTGAPILVGDTWNFQAWYRDPAGPCSANSNTTNALGVTFTL